MAADTLDLSVVIVSFNSRELLTDCLRSLPEAIGNRTYEVIVSDNASADETVNMLRREWPSVRVLPLEENIGFARASNLALGVAQGRYLLLFNPDARAEPGALDELIRFMDATPTVGVAAPRLLNADGTDQGTARAFPTPAAVAFGRKSWLTRIAPNNPWSRRYLVGRTRIGDAPFRVDWVSGACFMVRRSVVDQVGPLDEEFFMYWEDADWCRRIGQANFGVFCVPRAVVRHLEGQSSKRHPARLRWVFHRSAYHYYVKHHAPQAWHPLRAVAAVGLVGRAVALIALDGLPSRRAARTSPHRPSSAMSARTSR